MTLKQKVIVGLLWGSGAKFFAQLITWGITIVVIRLLSPADYGLMSLAVVFVGFLAMLNEMGLGAAVVQRKDIGINTLKSMFGLVLLTSTSFSILMGISAPLIADSYSEPRLTPLIQVMAVQFILTGFTVLPQSLLLRDMAFRKIAYVDFISALAGSITTLVLALAAHGVWALVWGGLMMQMVAMIGMNIAQPFLYLPIANMKGMRAFLSFGGYVVLSRIIWYLYISADTLIIGRVLGKEILGFYSVALTIATLPMDKVSGIINQVAFPAFASVQSEPRLANQHFIKAIRLISFMAFPILFGISSIAPEIVHIFLGPKWAQTVLPLQIIALATPIRMVSSMMNPAVLGKGHPEVSFYNSLVGFIMMTAAFGVGSLWGLLGVSLSWVIVFPMVFIFNLRRVVKVLVIDMKDIFEAMWKPLISGLVMFGSVMLVKSQSLGIVPTAKIILLVVCGTAIYILVSILINRRGFGEARDLLRATIMCRSEHGFEKIS